MGFAEGRHFFTATLQRMLAYEDTNSQAEETIDTMGNASIGARRDDFDSLAQ